MPDRVRAAIAWRLRRIADRIDARHAPRGTGLSFTFEGGEGLRVWFDGRGCPLWYLGEDDYERAYTQADTEWRPRSFNAGDELKRLLAAARSEGKTDA